MRIILHVNYDVGKRKYNDCQMYLTIELVFDR